ncbi:MAG: site-specific integrase [Schlesneria sp.]
MAQPTLRSFLDTVYIPSRLDLSSSSAEQCRIAVRLLDRWKGRPVRLNELSADIVLPWLRSMVDAGRSPATVNAKRGLILTIWRAAKKRGMASPVPDFDDLPKKREAKRAPTCGTIDEMRRMLDAAEKLEGTCRTNGIDRAAFWSTLIQFCYETGSRLGAALAVRVTDLDLIGGTVTLRSECAKTRLEQRHKLSRTLLLRIQSHLTEREFVWPWSSNHRRLWCYLKLILKQAGLPHDRRSLFHRIRRTTATWSAVHGGLDVAQQTLGHSSARMTVERYIDPRFYRPQAAVDVLPELRRD